MAEHVIDDFSKYESGTDPFTGDELEAIARYREALSAIPDFVFDGFDADGIRSIVCADGAEKAFVFLHRFATKHLNDWHDACSVLQDTMPTGANGYSKAAGKFLSHQHVGYRNARQLFEHAVTTWALGLEANDSLVYEDE